MSTRAVDMSALYELLYNPNYTPQRSLGTHVKTVLVDSKPRHILRNGLTGDYYEIDDATAAIWDLMDGNRTLRQIHAEASKADPELTMNDVREVMVSFAEEGVLKTTEPEVAEKRRLQVVSAFQANLRLLKDSSSSLLRLYNLLRPLFTRTALIASLAFIVISFVVFAPSFFEVLSHKSNFEILNSSLLGFLFYNLVVLLPVYFIHEAAHAVACLHYGGKPGEIGTGLFYFQAMFYCDTSDAWRLSRWPRIMVSMSGSISTVLIGGIFVFLSLTLPEGYPRTLVTLSAFFSFYGTLLNFSPVIETDGYYTLMDVVNIPDLRDESFEYLKRLLWRLLGRAAGPSRRIGKRQRRILLAYALASAAWLVFFLYTTSTITFYLAQDAFAALLSLAFVGSFDPLVIGASLASVAYFAFLVSGYGLVAKSAIHKIRTRRFQFESIHDKRVAIFLPLPSTSPPRLVDELIKKVKAAAGKFSRSYAVTWDPPLCVALLKLGRVRQSLEEIREEMRKVEKFFRSVYEEFLTGNEESLHASVGVFAPNKMRVTRLLVDLSYQIAGYGKTEARAATSQFLARERRSILYLLNSAFASVWTLELSPDDYRKIQKTIFPSLLIEDLSVTDLYGEVEEFKKHTVLGLDTIANLASELDREVREIHKKSEKYQATAFVEPIRGRLVFVGRTEQVEKALAKIGNLFLIQSWSGYFDQALKEAQLGLFTVRRAPSYSIGKIAIEKLRDNEVHMLSQNLQEFASLGSNVVQAIRHLKTKYDEALGFSTEIGGLIDPGDDSFDVGLYRAALNINSENLMSLEKRIKAFEEEFERVSREFKKIKDVVEVEYRARSEKIVRSGKRLLRYYPAILASSVGILVLAVLGSVQPIAAAVGALILQALFALAHFLDRRRYTRVSRLYTPTFDALETLILTATQSAYDIIVASDVLT